MPKPGPVHALLSVRCQMTSSSPKVEEGIKLALVPRLVFLLFTNLPTLKVHCYCYYYFSSRYLSQGYLNKSAHHVPLQLQLLRW